MGFEESSGYCTPCERQVLTRRSAPNHGLHLLLSVLTCGVWAPFWIARSMRRGGWRCSSCGRLLAPVALGRPDLVAAAAAVVIAVAVGAVYSRAMGFRISRALPAAVVAVDRPPEPLPEPVPTPSASDLSGSGAAQSLPSVAVSSGVEAPASPVSAGRPLSGEALPLVTLQNERVSIQTAAQRLCEQAHYTFDWQTSHDATQPDCRRYVGVNVAGVPLDKALEEVVVKNGLKYRIEGRRVWLEK